MVEQELRLWQEEDWQERLRKRLTAVPGLCVLDLVEGNILSYSQGDWGLVEKDVHAAFSEKLAQRILACFKEEVQTCLAVRRELINFKKLCLHLWQTATGLEKDLRQLASFYYSRVADADAQEKAAKAAISTAKLSTEEDPQEATDASSSQQIPSQDPPPLSAQRRHRYIGISNALNDCRGAVAAVFDARHFSKAICALPRHPASGVPWKFEALPESLELWKLVEQARFFLENYKAFDAYFAAMHGEGLQSSSEPAKPAKLQRAWRSERDLVESELGHAGLKKLLEALEELQLPANALHYLELVLIARGAVKATALKGALRRYITALREVEEQALGLERRLSALLKGDGYDSAEYLSDTAVSAGLHLHGARHRLVLQGMLSVMSELLRWLDPIADIRSDASRLFVSGARGAAAFVPRGFPDVLARPAWRRHRAARGEHREAMLSELSTAGWPKSACLGEEEKRPDACQTCSVRLSKLWLHRGQCLLCETKLRSQGRCPYGGARCSRSFCPHDSRCIVCEQWSCERCCLLRGDGEDVWQTAAQHQPDVIFLDFDRTLCTTKAGASPLSGNHSLDSDLVALCGMHPRVYIVTRNSRSEDIAFFLRQHGISARLKEDQPRTSETSVSCDPTEAMGQSSSGEPKRELLYAEDGITVIGSTFSTGGEEETAPEWFGMGPQSLGFVGPGPQINPKVYCTPHAQNRLLRPRNTREEAPNLTVFNRSPRTVNVSLGTDGKHFLQPGHVARFVLPDVEAALFVTDPCSGVCLCDLRGLPAGGQPFEALPHAILREVGGALCASLDYSFPRMEDTPDPSRKLSLSSVCETLEGTEHKASPRTIELEEQLLEALQCNNQCRAQEILDLLKNA
eukprot:s7257_g2.t7